MRKRDAIAALVLLAAFAGLFAYLARPDPPAPGVTLANAARIEVGMTEAEVVALMGAAPPMSVLWISRLDFGGGETLLYRGAAVLWSGPECDISVSFDHDGYVAAVNYLRISVPTWFERARRRLGL